MARIRRDVAYPKKVWPSGFEKPVDLAPLIPQLEKRQREFKEAGLNIPFVWRHDDEAVPVKNLQQGDGRLTLGSVESGAVDAEGVLVDEIEVTDEKNLPAVNANRHVSPWIKWNWRDGNGKVWEGPSILHVAVAARPVQTPQRAFPLSQDGYPEELRLALADYEKGEAMPEAPEAPKKEKKTEIKPGEGFDEDIIDCLKEYGLNLPPDTTEKNVWERIRIMCHAKKEGGGGSSTSAETPVEAPDPAHPVAMALSQDVKDQLERGKRAEAFALKAGRAGLAERIKKLRRNAALGKPVLDKLEAELKDVKLSLDDSGGPARCELIARIEALEEVPLLRLSHEGNGEPVELADPDPGSGDGSKLNPKLMKRMTGGRWKDTDIGFDE